MNDQSRVGVRYAWLLALSIALGWFEGAVVVYLRELGPVVGAELPSIALPPHVVLTEIVREAASLIVLASAGALAGSTGLQRFAAFLVAFGVWDLVYYLTLRIVTGWPAQLSDPDILFLIPTPWVGPVWAPSLVAVVFVAAGTYVFATPGRVRRYTPHDWLVEVAAACGIVASFLPMAASWSEVRIEGFSPVLYWASLSLGVGWFVFVEWRPDQRASTDRR